MTKVAQSWEDAEAQNTQLWQACKAAGIEVLNTTRYMGGKSGYPQDVEIRGFAATIYNKVANAAIEEAHSAKSTNSAASADTGRGLDK